MIYFIKNCCYILNTILGLLKRSHGLIILGMIVIFILLILKVGV